MSVCVAVSLLLLLLSRPFFGDRSYSRGNPWKSLAGTEEWRTGDGRGEEKEERIPEQNTVVTTQDRSSGRHGGFDSGRDGGSSGEWPRSSEEGAPLLEEEEGEEEIVESREGAAAAAAEATAGVADQQPQEVSLKGGAHFRSRLGVQVSKHIPALGRSATTRWCICGVCRVCMSAQEFQGFVCSAAVNRAITVAVPTWVTAVSVELPHTKQSWLRHTKLVGVFWSP